MWSVASIDQPIGEAGGSLHDVLSAIEQDGDPVAELERKTARKLLEGVTEESIATMDGAELAELRSRLAAADMLPSTRAARG